MKTTNTIKQWIKNKFGFTVKGNTSAGKSQWQTFYIPCDRNPNPIAIAPLTYSNGPFPENFRKLCIRTVYPNSPVLHEQTRAGNIDHYSISMFPHEWEAVMSLWDSLSSLSAPTEEQSKRRLHCSCDCGCDKCLP